MKEFKSAADILDFAVEREEESYTFYMSLAKSSKRPGMKDLFEQFAKEEKGHKAKILDIKKGKLMASAPKKIADLKISDYLVDVKPGKDLDYQQSLILAMKKEKMAFKLYTNLAAVAPAEALKNLFLSLAQDEARHKLRFEIEYDDMVMTEN
ncbi:MAG TPA: ferritin family protein [bacterium]|nr:ferritin family protein [bacterium]